ncbi:hypothetical protein T231_11195 [Tannerella sp. oral taxon BU063 isolate Cell 6/7/9]|uniref:Uncharacterized protein n=1 Tax=Tannerella sp. oral taxon BU063 isolate Cell 6/7/9 TaxID=1411021 RepID=W2CP66_9BACT|nr:hypothetical protein T231_11195 [Tannerella sp. oral taxon BU063 isolate Cell 6/7/9]
MLRYRWKSFFVQLSLIGNKKMNVELKAENYLLHL